MKPDARFFVVDWGEAITRLPDRRHGHLQRAHPPPHTVGGTHCAGDFLTDVSRRIYVIRSRALVGIDTGSASLLVVGTRCEWLGANEATCFAFFCAAARHRLSATCFHTLRRV